MTEKEIRMMASTCENYRSCALCPYNPEIYGERWKGGCPNYDRKLVYAMGKGYRKIPEGAVVLTDDNLEQIANMIATMPQIKDVMDELIKKWQKEAAREILNKVDCESNGQTKQITDLLRRKYGVEVEE